MFQKFFENSEKVRTQLLEGAITYEEWFNRIAANVVDFTNTAEYLDYYDPDQKYAGEGDAY